MKMTADRWRKRGACIPPVWWVCSSRPIAVLGRAVEYEYGCGVIHIRFADAESKRLALGQIVGRYSFKSWAGGEMMLPKDALALLADEGIRFSVDGPATYERVASLRAPLAAEV